MAQIDTLPSSPIVQLTFDALASPLARVFTDASVRLVIDQQRRIAVTVSVVVIVILVALIFDFTNGFHDSANSMAGPVATGALKPKTAVIIAAVLNMVGACLSTEVAKTISGGLFDDNLISASVILAGLVGAIIWNLLTWLVGLPSSSSHALFGGLIGAVIVGAGLSSINGSVVV